MKSFDIIKGSADAPKQGVVTKFGNNAVPAESSVTGMQVVSNNFPAIMDLAGKLAEIKASKVEANNKVKIMAEARKDLLAAADAYVEKKNVDIKSTVARMEIVRSMLQDFYKMNNSQMSPEIFKEIISETIENLAKEKNGQ